MDTQANNNRRIAKNTAFLYLKMLLTTILSLYSARLILVNLGVEDFGIYNVVAGVVTFMGFLTSSMSSATQRYLSYFLGQDNIVRLQQTFSLLLNVYVIFCVIVFVFLEFAGPFYIEHFMKLPGNRQMAAQCVFQFSLLIFLITTLSTPYRSVLIAYEKMDMFAFINVLEAILNVCVIIAIAYLDFDRLINYAVLHFVTISFINIFLAMYCYRKFQGCKYLNYWNKDYFRELLAYSGWNLFGSATGVMNLQGQALVLNFFFGPVVNAAKAIADKVNSLVTQFSTNFYMAVAPQIIKSYAVGNLDRMRTLVINSSRYSFFMMFALSAPLYIIIEPLLRLWLGDEQISYEMVQFSKYTILYCLINVLEQPITMAIRATGNIKKYQLCVGIFTLSFLPLCIIMFWIGAPSYYSMLLLSLIFFFALFVRMYIVSPIIGVTIFGYIKEVLIPIVFAIISYYILIQFFLSFFGFNNCHWILKGLFAFITFSLICFLIGLNGKERKLICRTLLDKIKM